ncbi:hypothetical protein GWO43_18140 [candidate division KSB1 bacterium]|nr:hypothetical protein [candidate division KSB1 bacterium]NIR69980.1 hypothetical protein [candidate division KSB1 bacterium]NIS25880.1 hypothetical protein [candidate division KSB1 bacterium]NIT72756.1 hypothetical protein [candidate division KSB1 bacterium]NIU26568.1 hypothetical protein [candidate division KSB1 bacterium]
MLERYMQKLGETYRILPFFVALVIMWTVVSPMAVYSQQEVPDKVFFIFEDNCAFAGCHAGPNAPQGLDLSEGFIISSLVNVPSKEKSDIMRVKPGDPVNSYLIMKLKGSPNIEGEQMPRGADPLSAEQIATIESWIKSMEPTQKRAEAPEREYVQAFPGLSLATLPTTQTLDKGLFSYRIAHRWRGRTREGFDKLFGLDFGARMYTQMTFAVNNDIAVSAGRSAVDATFEFAGKWRFLREKADGSIPLSAAIFAGFDWATVKEIRDPDDPGGDFLSRTDSERFAWFAQVALTKQVHERLSVLLTPGVLLNGNVRLADEDALITFGVAGKLLLFAGFSVFLEAVPIISGEEGAATVELPPGGEIYDSFTIGLERRIGGHVFHVYITNSLGLTTPQYMSGGNLDFVDGDFRLGFNIYRQLRLPF